MLKYFIINNNINFILMFEDLKKRNYKKMKKQININFYWYINIYDFYQKLYIHMFSIILFIKEEI